MSVFSDTMKVRKPKFNAFSHPHTNKLTYQIGQLVPVYSRFMSPGEVMKIDNLSELTRFAPMVSPVMSKFTLDFMAFSVPVRAIDINFGTQLKNFFNPATADEFRPAMPSAKLNTIVSSIPQDLHGTLYDFFNNPTFERFGQNLNSYISCCKVGYNTSEDYLFYTPSDTESYSINDFVKVKDITTPSGFTHYLTIRPISINTNFFGQSYIKSFYDEYESGISSSFYNTGSEQLNDISAILTPAGFADYLSGKSIFNGFSEDIIDENFDPLNFYLNKLGISSIKFWSMYKQYLLSFFIRDGFSSVTISEALKPDLNFLQPFAYWQIIGDWFTNSNIEGDTYDFIHSKGFDLLHVQNNLGDFFGSPFYRRWKNDLFTSCFSNPQSGTAVAIPTGTITDLRSANVVQKFKERRIYGGKRYIDSILAVFGKTSSSHDLDRSYVLGLHSSPLMVEALSQVNQGTIDNVLDTPIGTLFGQATSRDNRSSFVNHTFDEHSIFMVLACVRPDAEYFQGLPKHNTKIDYYDFLLPEFDSVGDDSVKVKELFYDPIGSISTLNGNFGFNRRYYEYMYDPNEVHGDFRSTLNYWNTARYIKSTPTLSTNFIECNPERDDINRIFAVPDSNTIYQAINFDMTIFSPISKFVNYDL